MLDPDTLYTVDILARTFSEFGTATGSTFIVNPPDPRPSSGEALPRVAPLPYGAFVTVWENSFDDDGDDYGVFARVTTAMSQPAGDRILVPEITQGAQTVPVVASLPGGFVVAWQDTGAAALEASKLFLQRFRADGTRLGSVVTVKDENENAYAPVMASLPGGEFLVVWEMFDGTSGDWRVAGHLFDSQGSKVGNELMFDDSRSSIDRAPIVVAFTESYLLFWSSFGDNPGIYARQMTADGSFPALPIRVSSGRSGVPASPRVAVVGDEKAAVVWGRTFDDGDLLAGRVVGIDGVPLTDEFDVEAAGEQRRRAPNQYSVAGIGVDRFAVTWEQATDIEWQSEIRLQTFCVRGGENERCGNASCIHADSASASEIDISDALRTLRTAVGAQPCDLCVCDVNDSGEVSAIDALTILRFVVGFDVPLTCPSCG